MNGDHPSAATLLAASLDFLRDTLLPKLDGPDAFNLRVAANAIDLVRREIELGSTALVAEHLRLEKALGRHGDLDDLRTDFCNRLAADPACLSDAAMVEALRETALDRLAIDQPSYSGYIAARG